MVTYDPAGKRPCVVSSLVMESSKTVAISAILSDVSPVVLRVVANEPVLVTLDTVDSTDAPAVLELTERLANDRVPLVDLFTARSFIDVRVDDCARDELI
jgi:hypothetical protein